MRQALERLTHAREALKRGSHAYVVRQCHETVELNLKGSLRLIGVEPPKWHDVGPILRREADRFMEDFRKDIDVLASTSRSFRKGRELAMYDDEVIVIPPKELYSRYDAEKSLKKAEYAITKVAELLGRTTSKKIY
ncbi:MAG: HEPN domain-containing protein [Nitrososphaeria archaeon]